MQKSGRNSLKNKQIRYVLGLILLCAAYYITGKIGLGLEVVNRFAAPVWPPAGIALAAILLYGYRMWPGLLIGAILIYISIGASFFVTLSISVGSTFAALFGAYLLKRYAGFNISLNRVKDILNLVILGAFPGAIIYSTIGIVSLFLDGSLSLAALPETWIALFIGNVLGVLLFTPLILLWFKQQRINLAIKNLLESTLTAILLAVLTYVIFSSPLVYNVQTSPFKFLLISPLIWIVFRYGQRGGVTAVTLVATVASWCIYVQSFSQPRLYLQNSILLLQLFIVTILVTVMLISAIIKERELAELNRRKLLRETIRLNKQSKYLQDMNKAKDEFISLASHQLRTPATGVKLNLGMLLENYSGKLTKKQRERIKSAYLSNERTIQTVDELLSVVQIDMGKIIIKKESADIVLIISNVIEEFASTMIERDQTIEFVHTQDNYITKVDKGKIAIVVENLIDNASKYSGAGKKIEVVLTTVKNKVSITVRDEGVGISKKDIGKLFKKFSRIHNEMSIARGGNGLGLYWVDKIVKLHGGTIRVASRLGHGTTFTVSL